MDAWGRGLSVGSCQAQEHSNVTRKQLSRTVICPSHSELMLYYARMSDFIETVPLINGWVREGRSVLPHFRDASEYLVHLVDMCTKSNDRNCVRYSTMVARLFAWRPFLTRTSATGKRTYKRNQTTRLPCVDWEMPPNLKGMLKGMSQADYVVENLDMPLSQAIEEAEIEDELHIQMQDTLLAQVTLTLSQWT